MTLHTMWQGLETTLSAPPKSTNCLTLHLVLATKIVPLMEFIYHPLMEIHFWWVPLHAFFNERCCSTRGHQTKYLEETFRFEDSRRMTTRTRLIWLEVFFAYSQKIDTPESFIVIFFYPEKLALLSLVKEVKPSPDRKLIKLLTFDNLFPPLWHRRMATAIAFSRPGSTTWYWNISYS